MKWCKAMRAAKDLLPQTEYKAAEHENDKANTGNHEWPDTEQQPKLFHLLRVVPRCTRVVAPSSWT